MTVSTFVQTDAGTQSVNEYSQNIDADISVFTRLADAFAPHEQAAPNMTVALDPGYVFSGGILTEVASQSTPTISPPVTNPRIDRIVIDIVTGTASVVAGVESSSPTPPSIPAGNVPVAQALLQPSTTSISNASITDERAFNSFGDAGGLLNVQTFSTPGSYTYTPTSGTTKIIVEVLGGGGAGGAVSGTSSSSLSANASGGGAGAYAKSLLTSGFSGTTIIVAQGAPATPAGNTNGANGGTSSFGSISAPGGMGGFGSPPTTPPNMTDGSPVTPTATGGNIVDAAGAQGHYGFSLTTTNVGGGQGGPSIFGGGGGGGVGFAGLNAVAPGAGGGGGALQHGQTSGWGGGAGGNGIVIVYEYA